MNRKLVLRIVAFAFCILMAAGIMTVNGEKEVSAAYTRYASGSVNIREEATTKSDAIVKVSKGTKLTCYSYEGGWYRVKYNGSTGYVAEKYVTAETPVSKGQEVVNYAKQFVGNPYVYGGSSLTRGTDCSGFTMSVYRKFGYSLPHSSSAQASKGTKVSWSEKQPGDLICYYGHVAIYMGNNKIVHASNPKTGIKISNNAAYRKVRCVRRIVK